MIASALPRSDIEDGLVGDASTAVKRRAQAAASQGFDAAKNAVGEVYDEAILRVDAEGLTPDGIGKAAQDIGQRVRRVAESAVTTAFEPTQQNHRPSTHGETDMADQTLRTTDQTGSDSPHGFEKAATKSVTDQALFAGRDLKDKACHVTQNVRVALRSREIRWLSQGNGGSSISDSGERRGNRTDDPCGILLIIDIDEQSTQLHGEVKAGQHAPRCRRWPHGPTVCYG
jgi:hypothetical protein